MMGKVVSFLKCEKVHMGQVVWHDKTTGTLAIELPGGRVEEISEEMLLGVRRGENI